MPIEAVPLIRARPILSAIRQTWKARGFLRCCTGPERRPFALCVSWFPLSSYPSDVDPFGPFLDAHLHASPVGVSVDTGGQLFGLVFPFPSGDESGLSDPEFAELERMPSDRILRGRGFDGVHGQALLRKART